MLFTSSTVQYFRPSVVVVVVVVSLLLQ